MKLVQTIILVILILLSLAAGAAKLMQVPQEAQFFADAGLGIAAMISLGAFQIVGGCSQCSAEISILGYGDYGGRVFGVSVHHLYDWGRDICTDFHGAGFVERVFGFSWTQRRLSLFGSFRELFLKPT